MDRAYDDARKFGWSREPIVEMLIPSTLDDTLAPEGQHVASLFCQHVAPELPDGKSWDDHRDEVADLMIATVDSLRARLQAERDRAQGADAARSRTRFRPDRRRHLPWRDVARPDVLGAPDAGLRWIIAVRSPGFYLCGSGTHPGGGVTGAPGHNAAQVIVGDLKRRRWRKPLLSQRTAGMRLFSAPDPACAGG